MTKNGVGFILGDIFANSSGHPEFGSNFRPLMLRGTNFQTVVKLEGFQPVLRDKLFQKVCKPQL
jgi:hypothetical protein